MTLKYYQVRFIIIDDLSKLISDGCQITLGPLSKYKITQIHIEKNTLALSNNNNTHKQTHPHRHTQAHTGTHRHTHKGFKRLSLRV